MKILLISPCFSPFIGVGALRMNSLAADLIARGEIVDVVKMDSSCYEPDSVGAHELPGIRYFLYADGTTSHRESRALRSHKGFRIIAALASSHRKSRALRSLLFSPEMSLDYDCCVLSCGPFNTLLPVRDWCKHHSIPFVLDYRDLWLYDPRLCGTLRNILVRLMLRISYGGIEHSVMRDCSAFVSVSPGSVSSMVQHYPMLKKKAYCIYNGYDDRITVTPTESIHPCRICILGKLSYYTSAGALALFQAVQQLIQKGYTPEILHIGSPEPAIPSLLQEAGVPAEIYYNTGALPYGEALSLADSAAVFIAVIDYSEGLGTKLFDYIRLNRPLVAYAPANSEFEELLKDAENKYVCQTAAEMAAALTKIFSEKQSYLSKQEAFSSQFSRSVQNAAYHALLVSISPQKEAL